MFKVRSQTVAPQWLGGQRERPWKALGPSRPRGTGSPFAGKFVRLVPLTWILSEKPALWYLGTNVPCSLGLSPPLQASKRRKLKIRCSWQH